jgi:tetratricopeptide (TPR) repeat protein
MSSVAIAGVPARLARRGRRLYVDVPPPRNLAPLLDRLQSLLGSHYTIERELGGGMSRVFAARETALGREVVIKVLPPEMAAGVNADRFRREIQLAASLQHPHIVPLLSAGSADDLLYYVMPMVEGESLRALLVKGGELPIPKATRILRDVSSALAYAHARGIAHRDIKPDNILISSDFALVTDFGVAKAVSESTGESYLTSVGIALGTPTYMAPEQAAADPQADHRVDVYALGAVAYEMLTGRPPFTGPNPQMVLAAHVTEQPEPVTQRRPAVPAALAALVMRCLEKKPADRWQTAGEIAQQLDAMATSGGTPAVAGTASAPAVAVPMAQAWRSRRAALGAAFVLGLAAFGTFAFFQSRDSARLDPKRVAVEEFENQTRDVSLDPIGKMAADWISQGIAQSGVAEVLSMPISTREVESGGPAVPRASRDRSDDQADRARAGTIIRGRYYRDGDSLRFQAELLDANTSRLIRALEAVSAPLGAPMQAIERLRQRVLGAVATLNTAELADWARATTEPPMFEAYQEYLAGMEVIEQRSGSAGRSGRSRTAYGLTSYDHFLRAFELDSTFLLAGLAAAEYAPDPMEAESLLTVIERVRSRWSPVDRALLEGSKARNKGDLVGALRASRQLAQLAPGPNSYVQLATDAILAGRPHEALRALDKADPDWRLTIGWGERTDALHLVGDYRRELRAVRRRRELGVADLYDEVQIFAATGRTAEVDERIAERIRNPPQGNDTPGQLMLFAAREYRAHGYLAESRALATQSIAWFRTRDPAQFAPGDWETLGQAHYQISEWPQAREAFLQLYRQDSTNARYLGALGRIAARMNDRGEAQRIFDALGRLRGSSGWNRYERAQIAALLGRRDDAVALVQQGWAEGVAYNMYFHRDTDFEGIRDYPPFSRLLHPKD